MRYHVLGVRATATSTPQVAYRQFDDDREALKYAHSITKRDHHWSVKVFDQEDIQFFHVKLKNKRPCIVPLRIVRQDGDYYHVRGPGINFGGEFKREVE